MKWRGLGCFNFPQFSHTWIFSPLLKPLHALFFYNTSIEIVMRDDNLSPFRLGRVHMCTSGHSRKSQLLTVLNEGINAIHELCQT
jgi:hypothetical protein